MRNVEERELDSVISQHSLYEFFDRLDFDPLQRLVDMEDEADIVTRLPFILRLYETDALAQTFQQRLRIGLERRFPSRFPDEIAAVPLKQGGYADIARPIAKAAAADFGGPIPITSSWVATPRVEITHGTPPILA